MNNIKILIDGVDYSRYVVSPLKLGALLDEQLDEANLTLRYIDKEYFEPQTVVGVIITNAPEAKASAAMLAEIAANSDSGLKETRGTYYSRDNSLTAKYSAATKKFTQTYTKYFIVASDNAAEVPVGSGKFSHEIYLIERTKILEGFIGDSLTFTNALPNMGTTKSGTYYATGNYSGTYTYRTIDYTTGKNISGYFISTIIKSIVKPGSFTIPTVEEIFNADKSQIVFGEQKLSDYTLDSSSKFSKMTDGRGNTVAEAVGSVNITEQVYSLYYSIYAKLDETIGSYHRVLIGITYNFTCSNTTNSGSKKWTVSAVVDRCIDLLEPKTGSETARFDFDDDLRQKYEKTIAPEFTFTKMNLREMLREIGGFIHAEPRLDDNSDLSNIITFDEYGSNQKSHISSKKYVSYQLKSDINNWCTALDSSAENLVNQLDYAQGVMYEPARGVEQTTDGGGFSVDETLRTETVTVRFEQNDSIYIPTSLPIYRIQNVVVIRFNGTNYSPIDITPYIYETSDYGRLATNNATYPNGKAFALYYTQGQKNIKGLFFKEENAVSAYFNEYAIVNIIRAALGDTSIKIEGLNLYNIGVQIQYSPIYSARVRTVKQTLTTGRTPRAITYNQSANIVESRYYGENLKGVVARLGNIEKTYTYILPYLSDIPQVGYLFDDNYYISAVYTEILQSAIKCTVGLSKDFNRLSQYVGISSNKRMWEVSEKQSQQRQSIYTEYMKASLTDMTSDSGVAFSTSYNGICFSGGVGEPITYALIYTKKKNKTQVSKIVLPVCASAIGNSMIFTFEFADNYSAGEERVETVVDGTVNYYGQYVPYGDYFGRFWFIDITFSSYVLKKGISDGWEWSGTSYPNASDLAISAYPNIKISDWRYRKDNRETPQITYELAAVSDDEEVIVGSGLMGNCGLVNNKPKALKVYAFNSRLNKINSQPDTTQGTSLGDIAIYSYDEEIPPKCFYARVKLSGDYENYKSFAIITEPTVEEVVVINDDEESETQLINAGGVLVLGVNKSYEKLNAAGLIKTDADGNKYFDIYLTVKKSI